MSEQMNTQSELEQSNTQTELEQEIQNINDFGFKTESSQSDMTLIVNSVPLFVNKALLEIASPVLKGIFDEKLQGEDKKEVTLDDDDAEGFMEFLACFYPSCEYEVDMRNIFHILPLAYKYKVKRLMKKSVALLIKSLTENPVEEQIYQWLSIAKQHSITVLEEKCMELFVDMYKTDIQRADEIFTLKKEVKPIVMSAMIPLLRSEASKYRFLVAGTKDNGLMPSIFSSQSPGLSRYINLDDFHDARYSMVQFKVIFKNWARDNSSNSIKTVSSFQLWNNDVDIKMQGFASYRSDERLTFKISGNKTCMIAAKIAMMNNIPGKDGIWDQNKSNVELSISFTRKEVETDGVRWHDEVIFVAHVLMNKPKPISNQIDD